jgi:quercetin dioxygenase-like cupin family protein
MLRRTILVVALLIGLMAAAVGTALGTGASGFTAETARGPLADRPLDASMHFGPATWAKLETKGPIDVAQQRIVISPGGTLGWHSHPGPTIVTIFSGTLSFYHAEDCTHEIEYATGQSFSNLPDEIHMARNEGTSPVVVFASYYLMQSSPPAPLRIDQPSPGTGCPE